MLLETILLFWGESCESFQLVFAFWTMRHFIPSLVLVFTFSPTERPHWQESGRRCLLMNSTPGLFGSAGRVGVWPVPLVPVLAWPG